MDRHLWWEWLVPRGFVSDRLVDVRCWMDAKGLGGWGGGWRLAPLLRLTPLKHGEGGHPQGYLAASRRRLVSVPVGVWRSHGGPAVAGGRRNGRGAVPFSVTKRWLSVEAGEFLVVGTALLDWDSAMDNGGHLAWPFRGGSSWLVNVGCWMDAKGRGKETQCIQEDGRGVHAVLAHCPGTSSEHGKGGHSNATSEFRDGF